MIIAVCVIAVLALLLFSPINIIISYDNERLLIKAGIGVSVFRVFDTSKKKPPVKKDDKEPEKKEGNTKKERLSLERIKNIFEIIYDTLKFLKHHLTFKRFLIKLNFGTGDAAQTGILTGTAWALFYNILGLVDRTFILKKHEVSVKPAFNDELFEFYFDCALRLRMFWALIMLASLLKNLKKLR